MSMTLTLILSFSYNMARKSNMNLKENPVSKVKGVCANSKDLSSMPGTHIKVEEKIFFFCPRDSDITCDTLVEKAGFL